MHLFPQCCFTITFTSGDNTNPDLKHPVELRGITKCDNESFNIVLSESKNTYM